MDAAGLFEGCHLAAQEIGPVLVEAGAVDGDAHRLFLEEGDAQRLSQHVFQARGDVDQLGVVAPLEIGVDHIALDRAWANDGDFDGDVVEFARLEPGQHGHLRPAFDLEDTDRIGLADHVVGLLVVRRNVV